jgi:hypothetical protein
MLITTTGMHTPIAILAPDERPLLLPLELGVEELFVVELLAAVCAGNVVEERMSCIITTGNARNVAFSIVVVWTPLNAYAVVSTHLSPEVVRRDFGPNEGLYLTHPATSKK